MSVTGDLLGGCLNSGWTFRQRVNRLVEGDDEPVERGPVLAHPYVHGMQPRLVDLERPIPVPLPLELSVQLAGFIR